MRILVCPDKFKDCLNARTASHIIAETIQALRPASKIVCRPISDGGDGFATVLTEAVGGRLVAAGVTGPQGDSVQANYGLVRAGDIPPAAIQLLKLHPEPAADDLIGIVEMASASGLSLLPPERRNPWLNHTAGTGMLIAAAAQEGARAILIGLGGSATHDLGLGALSTLGYTFHDAQGAAIALPAPQHWSQIQRISGKLRPEIPQLRVLCDVTNPLLGDNGAATVYAPQKGLRTEDIPKLEARSKDLAELLCRHHALSPEVITAQPGYGAAGGIALGLRCAADERNFAIIPGFDFVSAWLQLPHQIAQADIVITGEGSFDSSSMQGKGPGSLATHALALGKQVHIFAGRATAATAHKNLHLHAITPAGMMLKDAIANAEILLKDSVQRVFQH